MPEPLLRLAGIVEESAVDGPGLRLTIFTQGCAHGCHGCHNPETHDPAGGFFRHIDEIFGIYTANPLLAGATFSGGEPFLQPLPLASLAKKIHAAGGNILCYTGFYFESLITAPMCSRPGVMELLEETDILIDGPFIEPLRSLELPWRGSSNQRLLDRISRAFLASRSLSGR